LFQSYYSGIFAIAIAICCGIVVVSIFIYFEIQNKKLLRKRIKNISDSKLIQSMDAFEVWSQ